MVFHNIILLFNFATHLHAHFCEAYIHIHTRIHVVYIHVSKYSSQNGQEKGKTKIKQIENHHVWNLVHAG